MTETTKETQEKSTKRQRLVIPPGPKPKAERYQGEDVGNPTKTDAARKRTYQNFIKKQKQKKNPPPRLYYSLALSRTTAEKDEQERNQRNQTVYVSQSDIPEAGYGLFANRDIENGELIATYDGQFVPTKKYLSREAYFKDHGVEISEDWVVDSLDEKKKKEEPLRREWKIIKGT